MNLFFTFNFTLQPKRGKIVKRIYFFLNKECCYSARTVCWHSHRQHHRLYRPFLRTRVPEMHFENTTKQNASEMLEFASNLEKVSRLDTQRICFVRSAGPKNNSISYASTKYTSHSIISSHTAPSPPKTCTDTLRIQCYLIFLERQSGTENNGGLGGWVHVTVQLVQISYPGVWGNFYR